MLEKIEGNIRVDKLRAILLMEADFNQLNKLFFGHCMIKKSERKKTILDETFDIRISLNVILVAVNRRLVIEILKQKCRCGVLTGHNAMTELYIPYLFYYVKKKVHLYCHW